MQLYEKSDQLSVIMGGGRRYFRPSEHADSRLDGKDFIQEWKNDPDVRFVEDRDDLFAYASDGMVEERLVGLFSEGHMEKVPLVSIHDTP